MTRLDHARDNFAGVLLAWIDGDTNNYQLNAAASAYTKARRG